MINKMKKILYILLLILLTGCSMLKHEAERSLKKDIKEKLAFKLIKIGTFFSFILWENENGR